MSDCLAILLLHQGSEALVVKRGTLIPHGRSYFERSLRKLRADCLFHTTAASETEASFFDKEGNNRVCELAACPELLPLLQNRLDPELHRISTGTWPNGLELSGGDGGEADGVRCSDVLGVARIDMTFSPWRFIRLDAQVLNRRPA